MTDTTSVDAAVCAPEAEASLDKSDIEQLIPHRGLMLLMSRARIYGGDAQSVIIGEYDVFPDNPFFDGHFPGYPVLPGLIISEALAQAGVALYVFQRPEVRGKKFFLSAAESLKFRRPVTPGQVLYLQSRVVKTSKIGKQLAIKFAAEAFIIEPDGKRSVVASGKLSGIGLIEE